MLGDFDSCRASRLERLWGKSNYTKENQGDRRQHRRHGSTTKDTNDIAPSAAPGEYNIGSAVYDSGRPLRNIAPSAALARLVPPPPPISGGPSVAVEKQRRCTSLVGTVDYLCPEVISDAPIGPAIDSWGFGVLLFELATGSAPFRNNIIAPPSSKVPSKPSSGQGLESPHHQKLLSVLSVDADKAVVRTIVDHANKNGFTVKDAENYRHQMQKHCAKVRERANSHQEVVGPLGPNIDQLSAASALHPTLFNASSYAAFTQQQLALLATEISSDSRNNNNKINNEENEKEAAASKHTSKDANSGNGGPVGLFRAFISSIFGDKESETTTASRTSRAQSNSVNGKNSCSLVPVPLTDLSVLGGNISCFLPKGEAAATLKMSPALLDLLEGLLHPHPSRRLTLDQCRAHPWWHYSAQSCPTSGGESQPLGEQKSHSSCVFYNMYRYTEAPLLRYLRGDSPFMASLSEEDNQSRIASPLYPKLTQQQEAMKGRLEEERIQFPKSLMDGRRLIEAEDNNISDEGPGTITFVFQEEMASIFQEVEEPIAISTPIVGTNNDLNAAVDPLMLADDLGDLPVRNANKNYSTNNKAEKSVVTRQLWQRPSL